MSATWFENNCWSAYHHSVDGVHPLSCTGSEKSWEHDFFSEEAMELARAIREQKESMMRLKTRPISIANKSKVSTKKRQSISGFTSYSFSGIRYGKGPFILTSVEVLRS
jgi:hypothetical protein